MSFMEYLCPRVAREWRQRWKKGLQEMNLKYRYNELMYVNYSLFIKDMGAALHASNWTKVMRIVKALFFFTMFSNIIRKTWNLQEGLTWKSLREIIKIAVKSSKRIHIAQYWERYYMLNIRKSFCKKQIK